VAGVDEKAREGVRVAEKMLWRVVCVERRAEWMFWPARLVERLGRRVREQVLRALRAKRGVWAFLMSVYVVRSCHLW
jgi:hypothetical protein